MERETGIEPATNSLEDCHSIENKRHLRPQRCVLTIIFNGFHASSQQRPL